VRSELLTLTRDIADKVARHLVAAGQVIDEDADLAMAHAIAARRLASRVAVVREAVGLAAYAAGDWATAIAELRTYHRMTGRQTHLAELADCERALGRPERAIDLYRGADRDALDKAGAIELLIVAAGARGDLGQHDAAVSMLQVRELTGDEDAEWAARLRYAYADALLAAGRREEAREWFARAAAVDHEESTDAAERLLELDGITMEDDEDESDADATGEATMDDSGARAESDADEFDGDDLDEDEDEDEDLQDRPAERDDAARTRAVSFVNGMESSFDPDDDMDDVEGDDLSGEDDLADLAGPDADEVAGADVAGADVAEADVAEADRGIEAQDGLGAGAGLDDRLGDDVDGDVDKPAAAEKDADDEKDVDDEKDAKDEFVAQPVVDDEPADGAEKRPDA
jgi:tetratricopeptide (TPR) repeat protein